MFITRFYAALASIAALCDAIPTAISATHVVHEKRDAIHPRWTKGARVSGDAVLPVRIGLRQSSLENAYAHLIDVSSPDSPNYGKHWSAEKVIETFKPSDDTIDAVREWLESSGIAPARITHSDNKGWFAFHATNAEMEALLHTQYYEFEDSVSGGVMPACDAYHVPAKIQEHIDYITPGIKLLAPSSKPNSSNPRKKRSTSWPGHPQHGPRDGAGKPWPGWPGPPMKPPPFGGQLPHAGNLSMCDTIITPDCVAALYQIPPTDKSRPADPENVMGIFEAEA